jgi:two-component system CheB/CheR fusion protein
LEQPNLGVATDGPEPRPLPPPLAAVAEIPAAAPRFRVVGIGASAGGLESLENFFANVPPDSGMAYVVVQHLSPDFRSMMDELLSRRSAMPVRPPSTTWRFSRTTSTCCRPKKEMIIRGRRLLLTDKEPGHALTLPIDVFFRSLAQDLGSDAVAIVLSGSGSDGSRGICDVKRAGGLVLVEAPESAQFDGMPMRALASGVVDHVAVAAELARLLAAQSGEHALWERRRRS